MLHIHRKKALPCVPLETLESTLLSAQITLENVQCAKLFKYIFDILINLTLAPHKKREENIKNLGAVGEETLSCDIFK